jgi:signal transduction histidine kinase
VTDETRARWYRRLSLRTKVLIVASTAVAVVLLVGGMLVLSLIRAELIDTADDAGMDAAEDVAELIRTEEIPQTLMPTEEIAAAVQVVKNGRVIATTPNAEGSTPFLKVTQEAFQQTVYERDILPYDEDGPFRVVALGATTPDGTVDVFVAVDIEDVVEVMDVATDIGLGGLIVLVLIIGALLWVVITRTLAPVNAIRERADDISGSNLHQRVPEPPGRDEVFALARTINEMLGRLEDSSNRQEAFVADAAHELRSPIASLQARLETEIRRPGGDEPVTRDLLRDTVRMGRLVDHLLLLARSDAGTMSADRVPVDLDEVVLESVTTVEAAVPITTAAVEPVQVQGQPDLLEHVVRNLLEIAERYAKESVAVSLVANERHAILTIDDDGPGIPEEKRQLVLRRFVRIDESRERGTGGTGLGLAIVHEIIELHDGELEILDAPSGGARMRVLLPLS